MNPQLTALLNEGRRLLTIKAEAEERAAEEHQEKLNGIFSGARRRALELLAPIGATVLVEPAVCPDGWNPWFRDDHVSFWVRPFEDAGRIGVKLVGNEKGDHELSWVQEDSRWRYSVESRWVTSTYDGDGPPDGEVYADYYQETDSLAEALAMCERNATAHREAVQKAKTYARRLRASEGEAIKRLTPAEKLIEALQAWHWSVSSEGE